MNDKKMTIQARTDDRMRTVHATNHNSEMWVGVLALIVLIGITGLTGWVVRGVLRDGANINNDGATVAAVVFALLVFFYVDIRVIFLRRTDANQGIV